MFATFSQNCFNRAIHKVAIHALARSAGNTARKAGRKTETKAKGYIDSTTASLSFFTIFNRACGG